MARAKESGRDWLLLATGSGHVSSTANSKCSEWLVLQKLLVLLNPISSSYCPGRLVDSFSIGFHGNAAGGSCHVHIYIGKTYKLFLERWVCLWAVRTSWWCARSEVNADIVTNSTALLVRLPSVVFSINLL